MFTCIRPRLRRGPIVIALAAAAVTVVGGTAYAVESATADTTANTVINACVGKVTGLVRIVDAGSSCLRNETATSWNQTGPAGPQGPQGEQGLQGSPGPTVTVTAPAPSDSAGGTSSTGAGAGKGGVPTGATITFDQLGSDASVVVGIESVSEGLGSGNGPADVPAFSDVVIAKHVDGNSAALFAAATHHTNLGNATVQVPAAGGASPVTIHLHDVTINGFSMSGSNAGAEESLSLHFDDISYNGADYRLPASGAGSTTTTNTSNPNPSPSPSSTGWDLGTKTNP